jgi:alpha-L-rhamnosidase
MTTDTRIESLRSQVPSGVLAAGREPLRLTWRIQTAHLDATQDAYEVQAAAEVGFETILATTGVVAASDQLAVPAPGPPLRSREQRWFRVRVSVAGVWTGWSDALRVETGLLDPDDWVAKAITLPRDPGADRQSPSPLVRRAFDLPRRPDAARLHVTALGCHAVTINGRPVSDQLLAPGWTPYARRLLADTYDVTDLLVEGPNVIGGVLGDGWYRGRLGWGEDSRGRYGRELGLIAQLEVAFADGPPIVIASDASWEASTGAIRVADLYDGSFIDARLDPSGWDRAGFDAAGWQPARVIPMDPSLIEPRSAPPVRAVWTHAVDVVRTTDGACEIDVGQNIAGFLRIRVRGVSGDQVVVRHAEVLEPDGSLHTRSLRSAKATDTYVLGSDRVVELEPSFTFHGFRYAEIRSDAEVLGVEAVAISSDTPRRGTFASSDERLDRFHENVVWSQRDNFVSVPTDCPQRDERLGWTGDAQAFAATASVLFDVERFWASWLLDLALEQDRVLGVPSVVPDVVLQGASRYGRAGWADAATMVPWAVYEAYGDPQVLAAQWDSMVDWVESLRARLGPGGLLPEAMQFGDWLDPDAPVDRPWEAKADATFLANAYFARSARLLARAAAVLGRTADAVSYHDLADRQAAGTWGRWAVHAITSQTGCAVVLQFALCPVVERDRVAAALAGLVRDAGGRVSTGFLGTPLVLPALADAGLFDEAYLMLLCRDMPSWLYQVDQGASTVWERWDAIRPDGSIHPGTMTSLPDVPEPKGREAHMLSFNHYAYGAVIDWVYRHVAGLAPDLEQPGYRRVILAPVPSAGIDRAEASVETGFGTVAIAWRLTEGGDLRVEIDLPFGTTGRFQAPATERSVVSVDGSAWDPERDLRPGHHFIVVTEPRLAGGAPERAAEALVTEPAV